MITMFDILGAVLKNKDMIPLGVALIAIFFLLSSWRRRMKRHRGSTSTKGSARREPLARGPQGQLKNDLEELLVELQGLSRKISAEIDTRFVKLEAAIRDADRRIVTLNRLSRKLGEQGDQEAQETATHDVRYQVVYELADAGYSPVEIAKDLGKTPGEVELILNLRRQAESQNGSADS